MSSVCNVKTICSTNALSLFMSIVLEMLPKPKIPPKSATVLDEYDFIVVGGGTAGCVVASRLSEVSTWQVLLLEAGGEEPAISKIPALKPFLMVPHLSWNYITVPQPQACGGKPCKYSRAKMLGGCSSHNMMNYNRGNKEIFNTWAKLGNEGWSYKDVLPYFIKSEDNRDPDIAQDKEHHGTGGCLSIQRLPYMDINTKTLIKAMEELKFPLVDSNGRKQDGYSLVQTTSRDGERMSTNRAFLEPVRKKRSNLHIITSAMVTKVLIKSDTKTACGVEVALDKSHPITIKAKKEVIISAGFINSPQLLQLSGVGPPEFLEPLKIPIIKNLKVGYNLDDHILPIPSVKVKLGKTSTVPHNLKTMLEHMEEYKSFRNGPMSGLVEVTVYTLSSHAKDNIPDLNIILYPGYTQEANPCCPPVKKLTVPNTYYNTLWIIPQVVLERSRGTVSVNSTDPFIPPLICHNVFKDPIDKEILIEGLMLAMKIAETQAFQEMGMVVDKTLSPRCAQHQFGTKQYWQCALDGYGKPSVHGVGTCKMGPESDLSAVVDSHLRVHGVSRLRVIDGSIMPKNVNANTNAAIIMIGEKGADYVKEVWYS